MTFQRVAALTGVAAIVLICIGGAIAGEAPDAASPVQEIIDHFTDNETSIEVGSFVGVAGVVLLVFFGAYLRTVLSAAEGRGGALSALVLVGTSVIAVGFAIDFTITIALADAADDIEPAGVQALQALWDNDFVPLIVGALVFLIAIGLSIIRHGALPKWLGWVALALAAIGFTPVGFVAFIGLGLYIVIVSVLLAARATQPAASAPG